MVANTPLPLHFFIEEVERRWRGGAEEVQRRWRGGGEEVELYSLGVPSCVGAFEHQHTSKSKGNLAFFVVLRCAFSASEPRALIERSRAAFPAPEVHVGAGLEVCVFVVEVLSSTTPTPPTTTTTIPLPAVLEVCVFVVEVLSSTTLTSYCCYQQHGSATCSISNSHRC